MLILYTLRRELSQNKGIKHDLDMCHSLRDEQTRQREIAALSKLPRRLPCRRRLILTHDETQTITDAKGTIEVMPAWQWMLG